MAPNQKRASIGLNQQQCRIQPQEGKHAMVWKPTSFVQIAPQESRERMAYLQDCYLAAEIGQVSIQDCPCFGPIIAEHCQKCGAPTTLTPHLPQDTLLSFSTSFDAVAYLLHLSLRSWSLQDLRVLGSILRDDDPLDATQDWIHVYQHRHPLSAPQIDDVLCAAGASPIIDLLEPLDQHLFFIPVKDPVASDEPPATPYHAVLLMGSVVASLTLPPPLLNRGHPSSSQWITFDPADIPDVLVAHPHVRAQWHRSWQTLCDKMNRSRPKKNHASLPERSRDP